ncbi:MAG: 4-(cytidine 5'-diphospho)-2-C-methyl-D-erythritol kinase [Parasporobacterium sp.]|nr:4-(cytidine 5'-diphospho)-2-C-methyl-D-erythritol kinase [Parasporobacterium sp.]
MEEIRLRACGKVNLGLDVTGRRPDGYHLVRMIMQTVPVWDEITVRRLSEGDGRILLSCDLPEIPSDERNLAWRAADLFRKEQNVTAGVQIMIRKQIPAAAGMAGGSADAAGVLEAMRQLFVPEIPAEEMDRMALRLGADVPFCLRRGTYLAEGIGEKLTKVGDLPHCFMVIVKPDFGVSTPWAYQALDEYLEQYGADPEGLHPDIDGIIQALQKGDLPETAAHMENILELPVAREYPVISEIEIHLMEAGALKAVMSGSGPTVFGIFTDEKKANKALEQIGGERYGKFKVEF